MQLALGKEFKNTLGLDDSVRIGYIVHEDALKQDKNVKVSRLLFFPPGFECLTSPTNRSFLTLLAGATQRVKGQISMSIYSLPFPSLFVLFHSFLSRLLPSYKVETYQRQPI